MFPEGMDMNALLQQAQAMQAQLQQAQEDNVALGVAYEKAFDQAAVKAAAQAADTSAALRASRPGQILDRGFKASGPLDLAAFLNDG